MKKNIILLIIVIVLTITPLYFIKDSDFAGADGKAEEAITKIDKDYKPWFNSIWEPPGGETEGLLFSVQAAIGAGLLGYCLGYIIGKKKGREEA